jgi:hypothetical protein
MYLHGHKLNTKHPDFSLGWCESVFKEIWLDHEYSRYGVEVEKGDVVVDCGANVGFFTNYALNYRKAKHVYSFECDETYIECLRENTKTVKCRSIRPDSVQKGSLRLRVRITMKHLHQWQG